MVQVNPIHTEAEHDAALRQVDRLWEAEPGTPNGDRLVVLLVLIEAYEAKNDPIPPPDPIDAIRFRMEQLGLDRKGLESALGTRGRVSEILNRKRALSIGMIRRLWQRLGIPAEVLIRSTVTSRRRPPAKPSRRRLRS
jgi:HTH-type transcriptional regulator/antitoxin HigA